MWKVKCLDFEKLIEIVSRAKQHYQITIVVDTLTAITKSITSDRVFNSFLSPEKISGFNRDNRVSEILFTLASHFLPSSHSFWCPIHVNTPEADRPLPSVLSTKTLIQSSEVKEEHRDDIRFLTSDCALRVIRLSFNYELHGIEPRSRAVAHGLVHLASISHLSEQACISVTVSGRDAKDSKIFEEAGAPILCRRPKGRVLTMVLLTTKSAQSLNSWMRRNKKQIFIREDRSF